MSKATHQVFKRIVLHNKLLSEPEVDALLAEVDDPEQAVQRLIERHLLNAKSAEHFLAVYKKQLDKLFLDELGGAGRAGHETRCGTAGTRAAGPGAKTADAEEGTETHYPFAFDI